MARRILKARERKEKSAAEFHAELMRAREAGLTLEEIGAVLGVSRQAVDQMLRRKR